MRQGIGTRSKQPRDLAHQPLPQKIPAARKGGSALLASLTTPGGHQRMRHLRYGRFCIWCCRLPQATSERSLAPTLSENFPLPFERGVPAPGVCPNLNFLLS